MRIERRGDFIDIDIGGNIEHVLKIKDAEKLARGIGELIDGKAIKMKETERTIAQIIQDAYERGKLDEELGVSSDLSLFVLSATNAARETEVKHDALVEALAKAGRAFRHHAQDWKVEGYALRMDQSALRMAFFGRAASARLQAEQAQAALDAARGGCQ